MATFSIDFTVPDEPADELTQLTSGLTPYSEIAGSMRTEVLRAAIDAISAGPGDVHITVITPAGYIASSAGSAMRGVPDTWAAGTDDASAPTVWDEGDDPAVDDPFG